MKTNRKELTQFKRLVKFIDFLRTKVPTRRFKMSAEVYEYDDNGKQLTPKNANECGFRGCLLGWTAVCFPNHFKFVDDTVRLRGSVANGAEILTEFYGIDPYLAESFYYGEDDVYGAGSEEDNITPRRAANRLEEYLESQGWVL